MSFAPATGWALLGDSVLGATHARNGLPNQDAIDFWPEAREGSEVILAVADGHGSARSFRSAHGARLAVEKGLVALRDMLASQRTTPELSAIKRLAEDHLPRILVETWKEAVDEDLARNPFTAEELDELEHSAGGPARRSVEQTPRVAYGSTLLLVVLAEAYLMLLQLGDGDILVISDDGVATCPLPDDPKLIGNETTSLCSAQAYSDFRFGFQVLAGHPPAMVMASTDGLANSFRNRDGFVKFGLDICDVLRTDGTDALRERLPEWLQEATDGGSGDDITVGIAVHRSVLGQPPRESVFVPLSGDVPRKASTPDTEEVAASKPTMGDGGEKGDAS